MASVEKPKYYGSENVIVTKRIKLDPYRKPLDKQVVKMARRETIQNTYADALMHLEIEKAISPDDIIRINGKIPTKPNESLNIQLKYGNNIIILNDAIVDTFKFAEEKPRGTVETIHQWSLNKTNSAGDFTLMKKVSEVYKHLVEVAKDFQAFKAVKK